VVALFDKALCFPTLSYLLIVNEISSVSSS